ncbi:MAG: hypothetical protein ABJA80_07265 [bacterium]
MSSRLLTACVIVAACAACAKTPTPETAPSQSGAIITSDAQAQAAPERRNRDVITQQEMRDAQVGSQSVLDVVTSLRPTFLTVRGTHNVAAVGGDPEAGKVHASIDGNKVVGLDELRGLLASNVKEIRFLNPSAAMQRFGSNSHEGPVILVTTM